LQSAALSVSSRSPPARSPPARSPPARSPPARSPPARSPPARSPLARSLLPYFDRQDSIELHLMEIENQEPSPHYIPLSQNPRVPLTNIPVRSTIGYRNGDIRDRSISIREYNNILLPPATTTMLVVTFSHNNDNREYELLFDLEYIRSMVDDHFYDPVPVIINRADYTNAVSMIDPLPLSVPDTRTCSICLAPITSSKKDLLSIVVETKCCKQLFHDCCLSHFVCSFGPPNCPLCRHDFRTFAH
jgi:hypothetical protein